MYDLKMDVDGRKGSIAGTFKPGEAMFEFRNEAGARRSGLLTPERFTLLDTNVFHHFVFLARLYDFGAAEKVQSFKVIVPQEQDTGSLAVSHAGEELIEVSGRRVKMRHLRVDSGSVVIHLWVDEIGTLQKISLPERRIELLRK